MHSSLDRERKTAFVRRIRVSSSVAESGGQLRNGSDWRMAGSQIELGVARAEEYIFKNATGNGDLPAANPPNVETGIGSPHLRTNHVQ